jgi:hypothetical protein
VKRLLKWIIPVAAVVAIAPAATAQGGFGAGMPPEMQAKMKAWQKFRDNHKNFSSIQQTIAGIGECEKDPKTALTKPQAKKVLAVLNKWGSKPTMTNEEAAAANKELTAGMTIAQIKKVATAPAPGRGGRGFGGGQRGAGGPGGARPAGGGPGGGMANFKMPDPKEYNPLNPDTLPFEQFKKIAKDRLAELKGKLAAAK